MRLLGTVSPLADHRKLLRSQFQKLRICVKDRIQIGKTILPSVGMPYSWMFPSCNFLLEEKKGNLGFGNRKGGINLEPMITKKHKSNSIIEAVLTSWLNDYFRKMISALGLNGKRPWMGKWIRERSHVVQQTKGERELLPIVGQKIRKMKQRSTRWAHCPRRMNGWMSDGMGKWLNKWLSHLVHYRQTQEKKQVDSPHPFRPVHRCCRWQRGWRSKSPHTTE